VGKPSSDLLPLLGKNAKIKVATLDPPASCK